MTKRRVSFLIPITLLAPVLVLALMEGLFRLVGVFEEEPLLVQVKRGGKERLQFNAWVARRYFDPSHTAVPAMAPEVFEAAKSPTTFRVICVGGSTTAGFPFDCQVPFPRQLQHLLQQRFPARTIEVLNAGISAVSSFTVLDLVPELLTLQPDVLLVYMGHDEFYGAYGSGSTVSLGRNDTVVRWVLRLQKLRIVQLIKRVLAAARGPMLQTSVAKPLMAEIVADQAIPLRSDQYLSTMRAFRTNLDLICSLAAEKGVPVCIGTLVSNVRDFPPFWSATDSAVDQHLRHAREALADGRENDAEESYARAVGLDPGSADALFGLGKLLAVRDDTVAAYGCLVRAKDADLMRFRATEEVNEIIRHVASERNATVVDIQEWFGIRSSGRLVGSNWLVDHVHPDPRGYYQMALCFYETIEHSGVLASPDRSFIPADEPYNVTDLDWNIGLLKTYQLMQDWPFQPGLARGKPFRPHGDSMSVRVAAEYLDTHGVWSGAHYAMAEVYVRRRELERARAEYKAVSMFAPDDPYPYRQIARTYELQADWQNRERALREALSRSAEKGLILYHISLSQWKQGRLEDALLSMQQAVGAAGLSAEERLNGRFFLAGFLSDAGKNQEAVTLLHEILSDRPDFKPAREFLQSLERGHAQ